MKKQFMTSVVCFALLVIMFLGSSIAWFTDEVSSGNTITVGKYSMRMTTSMQTLGLEDAVVQNVLMPTQTVYNEITVINDGNQLSYVRTLIAFEDSELVLDAEAGYTVLNYIQIGSPEGYEIEIPGVTNEEDKIQIVLTDANGVETLYTVGYYQPESPISYEENPEEDVYHYTCLESITLAAEATSEWADAVKGSYEFVVLTQATQVGGFVDADEAFEMSFGELKSENVADWFGRVLKTMDGWKDMIASQYPVVVSEEEEFASE